MTDPRIGPLYRDSLKAGNSKLRRNSLCLVLAFLDAPNHVGQLSRWVFYAVSSLYVGGKSEGGATRGRRKSRSILIGDDELNFSDAEAGAWGYVPVAPGRGFADPADDYDFRTFLVGVFIALVILVVLVFAVSVSSRFQSKPSVQNTRSLSAHDQPSHNNQQLALPEFFPAGWSYISADEPTEISAGSQQYTIPKDCTYFVSLRSINGHYLAVAEDGSWNGWVKETGFERQIPMHPDFRGAKAFVEKLDWNSFASSYLVQAPSQADAQTDLQALRALEAKQERITMALFQKQDQPQNITVQGDEAIIPQPPTEEEQPQEKKVKLPKTKWAAEGAILGPRFSNWRWVCNSMNGMRCAIQDIDGQYIQNFQLQKGIVMGSDYSRIVASEINVNALHPIGWGCEARNGRLNCIVRDMTGQIIQRCDYDGRTLACRN